MKQSLKSVRAGVRLRGNQGQAAVEIAMALPVLAIILFATADVGQWVCASIEVANAARAGVQYAIQSLQTSVDTAGIQQAALNDASNLTGMTATAASVCECSDGSVISCSTGTCASGQPETYVQVSTSDRFNAIVPIPGVPSTYTVASSVQMRVQ